MRAHQDAVITRKYRATALTALLGLVTLTSPLAHAQLTDPYLDALLSTGAPVSPGNGLIQTLVSIDNKLGYQKAFDSTLLTAQQKNAELQWYKQKSIDATLANSPDATQAQADCAGVTQLAMNAAIDGYAATGSTMLAAQGTYTVDQNRPPLDATIGNLLAAAPRTCSYNDVNLRKLPWCKSVGKAPMASQTILSLFKGDALAGTPAQTGNPASVPATPPLPTLNTRQVGDAQAAINNLLPGLVAQPPDTVLKTPAGAVFMANLQKYNLLRSLVALAPSQKLAMTMGVPPGSIAAQDWTSPGLNSASFAQEYARLFNIPLAKAEGVTPSEQMILQVQVAQAYADDSSLARAAINPSTLQLRQTQIAAVQLRLQWLMLKRLDTTNLLLSALLKQSMQPVTTAQMRQLSSTTNLAQ